MEEIKQDWKKRMSWLIIAIIVVIVYKMLDNFSSIQAWFGTLFMILKPFLIGLLISYILFIPCTKIENGLKKSKIKLISKKARGISVITTYLIFVLIVMIIINCILPIVRDSIVDLISNIPNYYELLIDKYNELPADSILKSDMIKEEMNKLTNINVKEFLSNNSGKIIGYLRNIIDVFSGIIDVFVSIVVSIYILLQRSSIVRALRRFARAVLNKDTYEAFNKYFTKANEVFFTFLTSQLLDALIVGILTTVAMLILKVKYAPLLGFLIGIFNLIPYVGAIVAVGLGIVITFITGGFGQALAMAIVVIILQQIDANIINPRIIGSSLKTSPLLVLFSITVGGAYFGIIGMFLGVPIAVVIKAVLTDFVDTKNKIKDEQENKVKKRRIRKEIQ